MSLITKEMQIKTTRTNKSSSLSGWDYRKKPKTTSVGENIDTLEPHVLLVGMQNGAATVENIKNKTTLWFRNLTSGYLSEIIAVRMAKRY